MSTNLVEKVTSVISSLPVDKQQEILNFAEFVAHREHATGSREHQQSTPARRRPRALKGSTADKPPSATEVGDSEQPRRLLKGDLAHHGSSVTSEEIEEARREMWRGYMSGDDE